MEIDRAPGSQDPGEITEGSVVHSDPDDASTTCAGIHLIVEITGGSGLDDVDRIDAALREAVKACRATLLHLHLHRFSPQGVSGVAVLAESHISVHTWPEAGYGAFDIFMCGKSDPWQAVPVLRAAFKAGAVDVRELRRGEGIRL